MKRLLAVGSIQKYVVAGEQKAIVKVVPADKNSQEYARQYFNGMFRNFIRGEQK